MPHQCLCRSGPLGQHVTLACCTVSWYQQGCSFLRLHKYPQSTDMPMYSLHKGSNTPPLPASSLSFCSLGIQTHIPSAGGLLSKKLRLPNLGNDPRQMPFCLLSSPLSLPVPNYTQIIVQQPTRKFLASAQHICSNISGFH